MFWKTVLSLIVSGFISNAALADIASIPYPKTIVAQEGVCLIKSSKVFYNTEDLSSEAKYLMGALKKAGLSSAMEQGAPQIKEKQSTTPIFLKINKSLTTPESYCLTITSQGIAIEGSDKAGIFYGTVTLLHQIIEAKNANKDSVECTKITDEPRYHWRGFMLDEARHFFGKDKVKQLLDLMSYYKLNKFHWHLTDEQAWRIEIKKHPLLTSVGGKGSWSNPNETVAQFYTQEDIKEIVRYAADRHIEIIPEIDMPGHATAANRAYPKLSGGGTKEHPEFTFNPGKEEVYQFLTDVLKEITTLFPSQYIHLGGDEVSFGIKAWETDPDVQALMKKEKMTKVRDAEAYFMRRMAGVVKKLNKTLLGWDELVDLKMGKENAVIMWWRHDRVNQLKKSLSDGYRTIMCPRRPLYFDFTQHSSHKWGRVWNGFCPLDDVYNFPDKGMESWNLPEDQLNLLLGIQANLWTERVHHAKRLEFMIFPRLCALAEAAWSAPEVKNYDHFTKRMENAYTLFDSLNIYYFDNRNPEKTPEPAGANQAKKDVPMDFRD